MTCAREPRAGELRVASAPRRETPTGPNGREGCFTIVDANDFNANATPEENRRFAAFLESLAAEGLSPSTRACYASDWGNVAERMSSATGRPFRLEDLSAGAYGEYRAGGLARGVAPATLNRRQAFLRRYARFAAQGDPHLRELVASLAELPFQRVTRPVADALSPEAEEQILDASERVGRMEHALVALLVRTGVRVSEVLALVRGDVHGRTPEPHSVRVRGSRAKTVILPPRSSRALGAWLDAEPGEPSDPVFRVRGRTPLGAPRAAAIVARCAREAGVKATPRTLRHTFAVRYLAEHRHDIDGLSGALGGTSPALLRAWRNRAHSDVPGPRVAVWDEHPEESPSPGASLRTVRGSQLDAVRQVLPPGRATQCGDASSERLVYVLSGRVAVESGSRSVEADRGDVVVLLAGTPSVVRALGDAPAETFTVRTSARSAR